MMIMMMKAKMKVPRNKMRLLMWIPFWSTLTICTFLVMVGNSNLVVNPLATILTQKEIDSYYHPDNDNNDKRMTNNDDNDDNDDAMHFVLNVNYDGAETHKSWIGICLKTCHFDNLQKILEKEQTWNDVPDHIRPLIQCLIHYGYLILRTR